MNRLCLVLEAKLSAIRMVLVSLYCLFIITSDSISQEIFPFGGFPVRNDQKVTVFTEDLLALLDWENVQKYAKENDGHYSYLREDGLLTTYEYVKQGRTAWFEVVSFQGKVLEYSSAIENTNNPIRAFFFDKELWVEYSLAVLPGLAEEFIIGTEHSKDVLKAYYTLLGVDSRDEYGWICEYSTVGMPPKRRRAIIDLRGEEELLRLLLDYPNVQTQLYAADALIYDDYFTREMIKETSDNEFKRYLRSVLMSNEVKAKIESIRDSNEAVYICGNMGSYKVYESSTSELLSKQAVTEISENYEMLKEMGYFK